MDLEEETARFKLILFIGVLFLFSLFYSYKELKYLLFGTTVDATIDRVDEVVRQTRRGGAQKHTVVRYHFTDKDGLRREGKDEVDPEDAPPARGAVPVRYLAGPEGDTRLAAHTNVVAPTIFVILFAILAYFVVSLWREGTEDTRRKKKMAAATRKR